MSRRTVAFASALAPGTLQSSSRPKGAAARSRYVTETREPMLRFANADFMAFKRARRDARRRRRRRRRTDTTGDVYLIEAACWMGWADKPSLPHD